MGNKTSDSYMRTEWIRSMTDSLALIHPEVSRSEIESRVIKLYQSRFTDHPAAIYNNYENTVTSTSLSEITDWVQVAHPLIAESGVFFFPKSVKRNVNVEIIKECMLDARTIHKKEKFKALDEGDMFLAAVKDLQQANDKKAANSGYGAEGQSSSFLYNVHSAMSVTSCGRGQISTAMQCFDNLFSDYVKFFNMDEFFTWVNHIRDERVEWKYSTFDIVDHVPSKEAWVERVCGKFLHHSLCNRDMVEIAYDNMDDELRARTHYKSNMRAFFSDNWKPTKIYCDIMNIREDFVDPNDVPVSMKDDVDKLTDIVNEFVGYKYSVFRYEDRGKYQKRANIIVTDTDSTFIAYGRIVQYMLENVLPYKLFKNEQEQRMYKIKAMNVLSCFASKAIATTLHNYLGYVNVAEEDRKYIKMKNEFYYERVVVTYAKKSYIGLMARQESHIYDKPKLDVKGVNFFKSTSTEATSEFIYDKVLMGEIMRPKDGKVSLQRTYKTIYQFQQDIQDKIRQGDIRFMKRSIKVKSPDAYASPYSNGAYKAVYVWNAVNDDKDRIELPATITQVKVILRNKKDLAPLAQWPEIYERMLDLFEHDPNIGDVEVDGVLVKGKGIKSIAVPVEYDYIPDWLISIIDVETLVNDNMKLFTQLFNPLGLSSGTTSHNGSTMRYYTNIVRI